MTKHTQTRAVYALQAPDGHLYTASANFAPCIYYIRERARKARKEFAEHKLESKIVKIDLTVSWTAAIMTPAIALLLLADGGGK